MTRSRDPIRTRSKHKNTTINTAQPDEACSLVGHRPDTQNKSNGLCQTAVGSALNHSLHSVSLHLCPFVGVTRLTIVHHFTFSPCHLHSANSEKMHSSGPQILHTSKRDAATWRVARKYNTMFDASIGRAGTQRVLVQSTANAGSKRWRPWARRAGRAGKFLLQVCRNEQGDQSPQFRWA